MIQNTFIQCPLCGRDDTEVLYRKGDLNKGLINVICKNCSLAYINPRPPLSEYLDFHKESFLKEGHGLTEVSQFEKKQKSNFKMKSKVFLFLKDFIDDGNCVLDIGCGFGTLLHILRRNKQCHIYGIELSDLDVRAAKQYYNLDILNIDFDAFADQPENKNKFDIVILHHTFEHFPDPLEKLEKIKKILKPGGKLYIGLPNIMNIKKRPEIFFQIGHPFSYSPHSLQKILYRAGFKVIKYNRRAGYPGGMEVAAAAGRGGLVLEEGKDYKAVVDYVHATEKRFGGLRRIREILLFWLPQSLKIKVSRFILTQFKKY